MKAQERTWEVLGQLKVYRVNVLLQFIRQLKLIHKSTQENTQKKSVSSIKVPESTSYVPESTWSN